MGYADDESDEANEVRVTAMFLLETLVDLKMLREEIRSMHRTLGRVR